MIIAKCGIVVISRHPDHFDKMEQRYDTMPNGQWQLDVDHALHDKEFTLESLQQTLSPFGLHVCFAPAAQKTMGKPQEVSAKRMKMTHNDEWYNGLKEFHQSAVTALHEPPYSSQASEWMRRNDPCDHGMCRLLPDEETAVISVQRNTTTTRAVIVGVQAPHIKPSEHAMHDLLHRLFLDHGYNTVCLDLHEWEHDADVDRFMMCCWTFALAHTKIEVLRSLVLCGPRSFVVTRGSIVPESVMAGVEFQKLAMLSLDGMPWHERHKPMITYRAEELEGWLHQTGPSLRILDFTCVVQNESGPVCSLLRSLLLRVTLPAVTVTLFLKEVFETTDDEEQKASAKVTEGGSRNFVFVLHCLHSQRDQWKQSFDSVVSEYNQKPRASVECIPSPPDGDDE